jgi:hypothetical protein
MVRFVVLSIKAFRENGVGEALYGAASTVFILPPWEVLCLSGDERDSSLLKWRDSMTKKDKDYRGPEFLKELGRDTIPVIVTETSQRLVRVDTEKVEIEFPGGSQLAASEVLSAMQAFAVDTSQVSVGYQIVDREVHYTSLGGAVQALDVDMNIDD